MPLHCLALIWLLFFIYNLLENMGNYHLYYTQRECFMPLYIFQHNCLILHSSLYGKPTNVYFDTSEAYLAVINYILSCLAVNITFIGTQIFTYIDYVIYHCLIYHYILIGWYCNCCRFTSNPAKILVLKYWHISNYIEHIQSCDETQWICFGLYETLNSVAKI